MKYRVYNPNDLCDVAAESETHRDAWDKAIDAWKGVPTANRPKFRRQAEEAMIALGFRTEVVR